MGCRTVFQMAFQSLGRGMKSSPLPPPREEKDSMINPYADDTLHDWFHLTHAFFTQWNFPVLTHISACSVPGTKLGCKRARMRMCVRLSAEVHLHEGLTQELERGLFTNVPTSGCKSLLELLVTSFSS